MIGTILGGRYRVVHKLGEGATSEIYLAEHMHIGRKEAIKVLRPEVASDPTFVSRFRREARAINRVQHPNIIGIYDFGQLPDGRLYLAMEYGKGVSVDSVLVEAGSLELPRALHVLHQLASAVGHAHSHAVVHRDLKPANLMLVEHRGHRDVLKVLDFGMAKILESEAADQLTRQGQIFGTPAYMSPEQATGMPTDPRSDIYSVGCIGFELLTGAPPFAGNRIELVQAHLETTPPPVSSRASDLPAVVDGIIAQCLAKEPAERFQNGAQLCSALEQVPGYPVRAGATRTGRLVAAVPLELHDEPTAHSSPHENVAEFEARLGHADTAAAYATDVRAELYAALLELAESLLDLGLEDDPVMIAIGQVRALRDDARRISSQIVALDDQELRIEQTAREREGSLRFAIGELSFDLSRASDARRADLEFQVNQLEARIRELLFETGHQLDQITEKRIDLAAQEAKFEDHWTEAHSRLQSAVGERLRAVDMSEQVMPLVSRYHAIEAALAQMTGPDAVH
jgi:tRNA A-37 threonylcarbamoyl transferase component Bud32